MFVHSSLIVLPLAWLVGVLPSVLKNLLACTIFQWSWKVKKHWLSAIGIKSSKLRPGDGICNEHFNQDSFSFISF